MMGATGYSRGPRGSPDVYERLDGASPGERAAIVLRLIEESPRARLELPQKDGLAANLEGLDLSPEAIEHAYGRRLKTNPPPWWDRDFRSVRLTHADLQGANLFHANLSRVHLQYANLRQTRLWMADLTGALLLGADLTGASLMGAILREASLVGAALTDAGLRDADLTRAHLEYSDLRGANMCSACLAGAYLRDAALQSLDLSHADLAQAHIAGAGLDGCLLHASQFAGSIGEEVDGDYGWARLGYQVLRRGFLSLGDGESADWAYRRERQMVRLQARAQRQWARLMGAEVADALRLLVRRLSAAAARLLGRELTHRLGPTEHHQSASDTRTAEDTLEQPGARP